MNTYEYLCQKCGQPFEVRASMADYAKGLKPKCPHCAAQKAIRTFTSVNVMTAKREAALSGAGCGPACRCG